MQVVRVEFCTNYNDAQEAVDIVSQMLPDLKAFPKGSKIESWNIYKVEERTPVVDYWVEDGKVVKNHG